MCKSVYQVKENGWKGRKLRIKNTLAEISGISREVTISELNDLSREKNNKDGEFFILNDGIYASLDVKCSVASMELCYTSNFTIKLNRNNKGYEKLAKRMGSKEIEKLDLRVYNDCIRLVVDNFGEVNEYDMDTFTKLLSTIYNEKEVTFEDYASISCYDNYSYIQLYTEEIEYLR